MGKVDKPFRFEIRLSGSGGQGIILAAIVLADAAAVYEGREVCQSQAYGPEARGGAASPRSSSAIGRSIIRRPYDRTFCSP